jgi:16S rRNA processing protein RimM
VAEQDDWMLVGRIVGAFGIHGEAKVQPLTDFPNRFSQLKCVYLGDDRVEQAVLSARVHTHILLRLEGVTSRDQAQRLRGPDVWIPRSEAMELPEGQYFVDDIIGLNMETDDGAVLGQNSQYGRARNLQAVFLEVEGRRTDVRLADLDCD